MKNLYIFDCYGVILSPISKRWLAQYFPEEEVLQEKLRYYFDGVEIGNRTYHEMIEMISNDLNIPSEDIISQWIDMGEINYPLLEVIKKLKQKGRTALLSNAPNWIIEAIFDKNKVDLSLYFDKTLISFYWGMMKPDIKFYQTCIDMFNQDFENIYMIDDRKENLIGLEALNITPILMDDNDKVIEKLQNL